MIRPFTALCVLLAGTSGLYLYTEKHRTTLLDEQISKIVQDTQHIRERTAMLRAEWALLNQPDRLHALSTRFLPHLQPMAPNQFVQMASLARRLPEVAAPVVVTDAAPAAASSTPAPPATAPATMTATAPAAMPPARMRALAPIQIMASRMNPSARTPSSESPVASRRSAGHASFKLASSRPEGTARPLPLRTQPPALPASRIGAYEANPLRSLVSTVGAYTHPSPMQATAWRMAAHAAYAPTIHASYARSGYAAGPIATAAAAPGRSLLGFSHMALPAPVPLVGD